MSKTVIMGASTNPQRVSYTAAHKLDQKGEEFVPVGIKSGTVAGKEILNIQEKPKIPDVDTLTLYLGPKNQQEWLDYIVSMKPGRIIFNPGTENPELMRMAKENGIEIVIACTLVMLATNQY